MKLGSFEWRTAALPTIVLVIAASALLWFSYVRRPGVEQYLHQANLRLLRTMGAQLESRIDGIEGNLGLALQSFQGLDGAVKVSSDAASRFDREQFASFLQMYAGDLVISCLTRNRDTSGKPCPRTVEEDVMEVADEPPVAKWQESAGRARLYLGYQQDDVSVVANIDLQSLFADNLPAEREFDALVLADSAGRVIVQHSAEGLGLANVNELPLDSVTAAAAPEGKEQTAGRVANLRDARPDTRVLVGGKPYQLYVQPLSLSVQHLGPERKPNGMEQWTLSGLVAADRIRAASSAVSYDTLIWFGAIFIAVSASIPLLKLRMLRSHERLTRTDAALVSASVFAEVALAAFIVLDYLQFGVLVPRLVEQELARVADVLIEGFARETTAIESQMDQYQVELQSRLNGKPSATPRIKVAETTMTCEPDWACRAALRSEDPKQIQQMPYPFFDLVNWVDRAGNQRVKLASTAGVTPFINLNAQHVPWVENLADALRPGSKAPQGGVSVVMSPTTGKRLTVFWKARPAQADTDGVFRLLVGQSLAANPLSLDQPVLPADTGFAIVDSAGLVLFHSDRTRSMKENFVQESDNSLRLRTLVQHRRAGVLGVNYRAREHLLVVRPLTFEAPTGGSAPAHPEPSFKSPNWSLIVFQEHIVPDTLNLYTLATAGYLFMGYALALVVVCFVAILVLRKRALAWLWPDRRQAPAYWAVAAINVGVVLLCVVGVYSLAPPRALMLMGAGVMLALGASIVIPSRSKPRPADAPRRDKRSLACRWLPAFVSARASLILMLAVVPTMATMHAATSLEQRMYMLHNTERIENGERVRIQRLQARIPVNGLCSKPDDVESCDAKVAAYQSRLQNDHDQRKGANTLFPEQRTIDQSTPDQSTWSLGLMQGLLKRAHPPVNDLGVGLAALVSEVSPQVAPPSLAWLLVLPVVGLLVVWLVRDVTDRLCLPGLETAPGPAPDVVDITAVNRLVLTLPGADTARAWRNIRARHVDGRLQPMTWPAHARPSEVVIVHNLHVVLADRTARLRLLSKLEDAVYQQGRSVWLVCDREPVRYLDAVLPTEAAVGGPTAQGGRNEVNRWVALLQSFRCEVSHAGLAPLPQRPGGLVPASDPLAQVARSCPALEPLIDEIRQRFGGASFTDSDRCRALEEAVEPYYRSLWTSCSLEERLVLRQLSEEGLVNPRDRDVLLSLMRKGFVVREPRFRLMNESFARFVKRAVPARTISDWERQVAGTPWSSIRTAVITSAVAGAGFVAFTQQQIVSAWIGFLPALAPALVIPVAREVVGKMFAQGFIAKDKNV